MVASLPMLLLVLLIGLIVLKSRMGRTTTLSIKGLGIAIQFRSGDGDDRCPVERKAELSAHDGHDDRQ